MTTASPSLTEPHDADWEALARFLVEELADAPVPSKWTPHDTTPPPGLTYALTQLGDALALTPTAAYGRLLKATAHPHNTAALRQAQTLRQRKTYTAYAFEVTSETRHARCRVHPRPAPAALAGEEAPDVFAVLELTSGPRTPGLLEESPEALQAAAFENAETPLAILDLEGRLLSWNLRFGEVCGAARPESGMALASLYPERIRPALDEAVANTPTQGPQRVLAPAHAGAPAHHVRFVPLNKDGGPRAICFVARQPFAPLQEEHACFLFEKVIETSKEAIAISDPEGRFLYTNPAHKALFGDMCSDEPINYRDLYPPESIAVLERDVAPALDSGQGWEGELLCYDKNGRLFPLWERADSVLDEHGAMLFAFGLMHDATAAREAVRSLETLGGLRDTLWEILPICVAVTDEQGRILDVTPAAEQILGIPPDDLIGKRLQDEGWPLLRMDGSPLPPEHYPSRIALEQQRILRDVQIGFAKPDGGTAWLTACVAPLPLEGYGVALAVVDITATVEAERALLERERRYRMAVEAGRIGVWEWDIRTGGMRLDDSLKSMLGYAPHEIRDHIDDWSRLVHPDDNPAMEAALQRHFARETEMFEFEHRMLHRDGSLVWVLARGAAHFDAHGEPTVMVGADLDISMRKHAEQTAHKERQRLFTLLDRLPAYVCLLDPELDVRFANRFFKEEFDETTWRPWNANADRCPPREVLETSHMVVWEMTSPASGRSFQVYDYPFEDVDGEMLVLELGIDVTAFRQAQEALQASEARYRSITDNLAMGIALVDDDHRVVAANPTLRAWYSDVDFDRHPQCATLVRGECPAKKGECAAMWSEHPPRDLLLEIPLPTGRRSMRFNFYYAPLQSGRRAFIVLIEDVTQRLLDQARMQRVEKLEALGALAGGIAHEINQPLNALELYVSSLHMRLEREPAMSVETIRERLDAVLRECGKISEIITHMRSLVRQGEATGLAHVNPNHAVRLALSLLSAQLERARVHLTLELEDVPEVHANPVQLEQVVINLVVNAIHAFEALPEEPRRRRIIVRTRLLPQTPREQGDDGETPPPDTMVELAVVDNGPGVAEDKDRLFDPFYTTKEVGAGMGLGLSIVHTMTQSWGGEVTVENNPGGGAAFLVRLRAVQDTPATPNGDE